MVTASATSACTRRRRSTRANQTVARLHAAPARVSSRRGTYSDFGASLATTPDVVAPEAPGHINVTPHHDLHDGDVVTVSGAGGLRTQQLTLYECNGLSTADTCNNRASVTTGPDKRFATNYTVKLVRRTATAP